MDYTIKDLTPEQAMSFLGFYIMNINQSWRTKQRTNGNFDIIGLNVSESQKAQIIEWEKGERG